MRRVMDSLMASLTAIDDLIRQQRRAMATIAAVENMDNLQTARNHVRAAQRVLVLFEPDALPTGASGSPLQTPAPPPGQRKPSQETLGHDSP